MGVKVCVETTVGEVPSKKRDDRTQRDKDSSKRDITPEEKWDGTGCP